MLLTLVASASATLASHALDPDALAVLSDATAFGDVTDIRTVFENERIWTVATIDLLDLDDEAEVWIPGGCVGDLCLTVAGTPWVRPGERVFVFLRKQEPTSWSQGLFHVTGTAATRDTHGLGFADGVAPVATFDLADLRRSAALIPK